jgi:hypothetical protein
MKATINLLAITILLLIVSCGQTNEKKRFAAGPGHTTTGIVDTNTHDILKERKQIEDQKKTDSLNDDKVLEEAIKIAAKHRSEGRFKESYVTTVRDSSYQVEVEITSGFYFSNQFPHLVIRRTTPGSVYIDIFSRVNGQFQKVLSHEKWTLEYTGDTIRDVNGDGLKDFILNWYGNTGCCMRGFSDVYLQRSDKKTFSASFEFINPTFSPKEQIIRGVCYGQPGDTEMYKYKWSGETVDTVEYIYYEKNDNGEKTGKVIVSNNFPYSENHRILKRLRYIPAEYRKIEGYDWFTDSFETNSSR